MPNKYVREKMENVGDGDIFLTQPTPTILEAWVRHDDGSALMDALDEGKKALEGVGMLKKRRVERDLGGKWYGCLVIKVRKDFVMEEPHAPSS